MRAFSPVTTTLRGKLTVGAPPEAAFPLFSPEGERLWVPGWNPEILHPPEGRWEQGQIFRTREETGEAVWVISRLDPAAHEAEYHRVEPGRYVAHIEVACRPASGGSTEVSVAYTFVGLSERGNGDIAAMTQADYESKMQRWAAWIREHLSSSGS